MRVAIAIAAAALGIGAPAEAAIVDITFVTNATGTGSIAPQTPYDFNISFIGVYDFVFDTDAITPAIPSGERVGAGNATFVASGDNLSSFYAGGREGDQYQFSLNFKLGTVSGDLSSDFETSNLIGSNFHYTAAGHSYGGRFDGSVLSVTTRTLADVPAQGLGFTVVAQAVPEPATWAMMLLGFGGIGAVRRKRTRAKSASLSV